MPFWRQVNEYCEWAWQRHNEGYITGSMLHGGGEMGFMFKVDGSAADVSMALTIEELFGPDDGPFDANEIWRY